MANSDWETDDETETNYMEQFQDGTRSREPSEAFYADDERYRFSVRRKFPPYHRRRQIKAFTGRGRGKPSLPKPARSFYEVERIPNQVKQLYPQGPEVLTRLKHSGYPENTEKRFRQWTDSDSNEETTVQRAFIGMPTSSFASNLESESGECSDSSTPVVQSTEQFLLSLQHNGDGADAASSEVPVLSSSETMKAEADDDVVDDGESDVSNYVMPSLIAHQERAWKARATQQPNRDERQDPPERSSEKFGHTLDMDSLQDGNADLWSVTSETTSSLPQTPAPSSSNVMLSESHSAEDGGAKPHSSENEYSETYMSKDPDETCRVEDVQILEGDSDLSELKIGGCFNGHRPRDEAQFHFNTMHRFLSIEGEDSPLIDLRIRVQGVEFQTHRLLMATFSRYFQELSDEGRLKPHCIVILDSLSPNGFARVLEWINGSRLDLHPDNVKEVLRVAKTLGVRPVVDKCQQYLALMESHNDPATLYEYAIRNGLLGAVHENGIVAASGFPEICRNRKYLEYTANQLCLLLSRDDLQIGSETEVYNVACDWLLQAWDTRQKHVCQVMQCVRFKLMSPFELRDILLQSSNPIALNVHVVIMLLHALLYLALKAANYHEPRLGATPAQRTCLKRNGVVGNERSSEESSGDYNSLITNTELLGRSSLATDQKELLTSATTLAFNSDTSSSEPCASATAAIFKSGTTSSGPSTSTTNQSIKLDARVDRAAGGHGTIQARLLRKRKLTRRVAATRIQAIYRGHLVRKRIRDLDNAATTIQKAFRGHLVRQELLAQEKAAAAIQRGYRRYSDHKKYDFLTAAASYTPVRRTTKHERLRDPTKRPEKPYFHLPPDPAFVCFGGITTDPGADLEQVASSIYAFDIQSDGWHLCGTLPEPRADAAACLLGNSVILTGGYDPTGSPVTSTSTVWMLDIATGEWEIMPGMLSARRLHGQAIANGKVYVVGGCGDGSRPLVSTEVYEPQLNRWIEVESMEVPRFAAAVASHCDKIWVCGGILSVDDNQTRKITHQVEVYDPQHDKWSRKNPLPAPRAFCDLASVDDTMLLIAGGVEGSFFDEEVYVTSTILSFDFELEKWRYLMNLPGDRYKAKIVSRDPYWFVVGGESAISGPSLSTVECFDTHDQRWVAIPHLPVSLQGTCCISIS